MVGFGSSDCLLSAVARLLGDSYLNDAKSMAFSYGATEAQARDAGLNPGDPVGHQRTP